MHATEKKKLRSLLQGLLAASEYGLSLFYYQCFLLCAAEEGQGLPMTTIAGLEDTTTHEEAYMAFKTATARLMEGENGRTGLKLLKWGGKAWSAPTLVQRRAREIQLTQAGYALLYQTGISARKMIHVLEAGRQSGVISTRQLALFIICALNEGECLPEIFYFELNYIKPGEKEYRQAYTAVRRLMNGCSRTGGLHLLSFGHRPGAERQSYPGGWPDKHVFITGRGRELLRQLSTSC